MFKMWQTEQGYHTPVVYSRTSSLGVPNHRSKHLRPRFQLLQVQKKICQCFFFLEKSSCLTKNHEGKIGTKDIFIPTKADTPIFHRHPSFFLVKSNSPFLIY